MAKRRKNAALGCEMLGDRCLLSAGGFATISETSPLTRATTAPPLAPAFESIALHNFDDLKVVKHADKAAA
jgi:hypothetical protein